MATVRLGNQIAHVADPPRTWTIHGIEGCNEKPAIAGSESGIALLLGGGRCVWEDYAAARAFVLQETGVEPDVTCINRVAEYFLCLYSKAKNVHAQRQAATFRHWWTLHEPLVDSWKVQSRKFRRVVIEAGHKHVVQAIPHRTAHFITHGRVPAPSIDYCWRFRHTAGTSGAYAMKGNICLGYERIIACGIPLDGSGHFHDPPGERTCQEFDRKADDGGPGEMHKTWLEMIKQLPVISERVRSMSGYTREWLGAPDAAWLASATARRT